MLFDASATLTSVGDSTGGYGLGMELTQAKTALYAAWAAGLVAVVIAGRFAAAGGVLFVIAGVLLAVAVRLGAVAAYNGTPGRPRLDANAARLVLAVTYVVAVIFVGLGVSLIVGG